jgi:hypothetical protein
VRVRLGDDVADGMVDVLQDPRTSRPVVAMRRNLETITRGQQAVATLRRAVDRLERTNVVLEVYGRELKRWAASDSATRASLQTRADSVTAQADRLLRRLRVPPDTKGIVEDTTLVSRVQRALGRATSTPDEPSPGRVAELDWTIAAANALLADIDRFYQTVVIPYREALRAAGFEPLGGT